MAGIVDQPVRMVGMEVGQHDMGDVVRCYAAGPQIVRQLAQCRLHRIAGAGVDEDGRALALEQEVVDGDENGVRLRSGERGGFGPVDVEKQIERRLEHAVVEDAQVEAADADRPCHVKIPRAPA